MKNHWVWRQFCKLVVKVYYQKVEVMGDIDQPDRGGILFCANHINALVDPVIVQASTDLPLRTLARSGLFTFPMRILLNAIGAIPVYRAKPGRVTTADNLDTFQKCYETLGNNGQILIFPEGQSHSDPHLHDLKTGAARIAIRSRELNGAVTVIPVGLTFTRKGRFRSTVLVHYGKPVNLQYGGEISGKSAVNLVNRRISDALVAVTLNAESWTDIELVDRLEQFFSFRHGKYRNRNLSQRFRSLQRLIDGQKLLQVHEPQRVRALISQLKGFERLCNILGIRDYHMDIHYRPLLVVGYLLRVCVILCLALPIALFGIINSFAPFKLTRFAAARLAKGEDQIETAKILLGLTLFVLFWGIQGYFVYSLFGFKWLLVYLLAVIISSCVSLSMRGELQRIINNVKVFFVFMRNRQIREYIEHKRSQLEVELAQLVRIAKRLTEADKHPDSFDESG